MSQCEESTRQKLEDLGYRVLRGGWPDYLAVSPDGKRAIGVECKPRKRPYLDDDQIEMHKALRAVGIDVVLAYDGEAPAQVIDLCPRY